MTAKVNRMTQLIGMVTEQLSYQAKEGMGDKLIDYLVSAHYDSSWEGFSPEEIAAYETLAGDIIIALEADL